MAQNKVMTEEQALQQLTFICSQSEHCQHEMLEKMQKWGVSSEAQARIMEYLISERYVDDERYCRGYIHDKMMYNHWGRRKIEQMLWMKDIRRDISDPLFAEIDDEQWLDILRPLIEQKRRSVKGRNAYEVNQKLMRFAAGRGFTFDLIGKVVSEDYDCDE